MFDIVTDFFGTLSHVFTSLVNGIRNVVSFVLSVFQACRIIANQIWNAFDSVSMFIQRWTAAYPLVSAIVIALWAGFMFTIVFWWKRKLFG